ncbi:MAG: TMEM175 family protein [Thermomicrobiales bacterium]
MSGSQQRAPSSEDEVRAERIQERKKRGFDRFLLFTDAVVAIAITLLVLPVVERAADIGADDLTVSGILRESGPQIYGFLLSFAVIAVMWLRHQEIFQNVETINRPLVWANLGWLLTIVFLVFTTALTALHGNESIAAPIYIANVGLSSLALTLSVTILSRKPDLLYPGTPPYTLHLRGSWIVTGLLAFAVLLVLVIPAVGYFAMLLLVLQKPLIRRFVPREEWVDDWDS